ncbi:MAG: PAS domain S-box protein [Gammaproteobacteria bacterium]|nr:PAS domain S-box protein [Gammaproteobacteria bacterium]NNM11247.1 PAS domain S-box protein [Pseudomonadales bacterium]
MRNSARWPLSLLFLCGLLIVLSWSLSRDLLKSDLHQWHKSFAEIKLLSSNVTHDLLELRGNFENDFDSLTARSLALSNAVESITENSAEIKTENSLAPKNFKIDTSAAETLAKTLREMSENFKTDISIINNSKSVALQLLIEMRSLIGRNNAQWQAFLNTVENRLLQQELVMQRFETQSLSDYVQEKTVLLESKSKQEHIAYFLPHIKNLELYNPQLDRLIENYLAVESLLQKEIDRLERILADQYESHLQSNQPALIALGLCVLFVLIYGGYFVFRSFHYSRQLHDYSRNLEQKVENKTRDLQNTMQSLNHQVEVKRIAMESLEAKEAQLAKREAFFRAITETAPDPIILIDSNLRIRFVNKATDQLLKADEDGVTGQNLSSYLPEAASLDDLLRLSSTEIRGRCADKTELELRISIKKIESAADEERYVCILHDLTSQKSLEKELSQAQKLESVGQLAAGIAHEINTPAQFISDNLIFLQESIEELFDFIRECKDIADSKTADSTKDDLQNAIDGADLDYLIEEVPSAINQSSDGIKRIATIVRAMKDYSHPGSSLELSDLNAALQSTLTVSRGEWKYCAEIETSFDEDLPLVPCVVSDINQVALNIIVNAAHAIEDRFSGQDETMGKITISTKSDGDNVVIQISDNGNGMPEEIRNRIFDPFFTTKKVGKGTGQGLSIAYKLIVDKHSGHVDVTSEPGKGTTFTISLPLKQETNTGEDSDPIESAA